MSAINDNQISKILNILERNLNATKNQDDLSSDSEFEMKTEEKRVATSRAKASKESKEPTEPVGKISHQKFCIKCGSADNLFRNNKYKTCVVCCNGKTRLGQSDKQKENFQKCREVRLANVQRRKDALREFEEQAKIEMDSKIVKKAVGIKKKLIVREAQLEEVSDDDTPLEQVIKVAKKTQEKKVKKSIPKKQESEAKYEVVEENELEYEQPTISFM